MKRRQRMRAWYAGKLKVRNGKTKRGGKQNGLTNQKIRFRFLGERDETPRRNSRKPTRPSSKMDEESEFVVGGDVQGGGFLVFSHPTLEEVLFLLDVHHLGEPGQRVLNAAGEGCEATAFEAAVCDVIDVG